MKHPPVRVEAARGVLHLRHVHRRGQNDSTHRLNRECYSQRIAADFNTGCRLEVGGPIEPSDIRSRADTRLTQRSQRNLDPPQGARTIVRPVGKAGPARAGSSHSEHIRGDGVSGYPAPTYLGKNMGVTYVF